MKVQQQLRPFVVTEDFFSFLFYILQSDDIRFDRYNTLINAAN